MRPVEDVYLLAVLGNDRGLLKPPPHRLDGQINRHELAAKADVDIGDDDVECRLAFGMQMLIQYGIDPQETNYSLLADDLPVKYGSGKGVRLNNNRV